ncbi:hypothetical protein SAMN04487983_1005188 [Streptomyces sp. yr375]|uniref:hypothetical protein n=1 Tax=Streptomyces sp. yr375 TaxID=1761906 RepID=UPI0008C11E0F|nr:hypothetical protein [Streptomyces sp. yr375]SEQ48020.1 hypothetical protein SAMN04487983_1005188 [Streptomyces sp. yr375]
MTTERPENDDAARKPEETTEAGKTQETAEAAEPVETPEAAEAGKEEAKAAEPGLPVPEAVEPDDDEPDAVEPDAVVDSGPDDDEPSVASVSDAVADADESGGSRRRSPVLIASVAAAVLLVGGGGAYLTSSAVSGAGGAGSGAPSGDGTPAALPLDDYAGGTGAPEGGTNGIAPGEPNPYGVTYKAAGTLPDGPDSASAYWAKSEVTKDDVARLAKALGATGTPVVDGGDWKVGSGKDGSGPVLRVNRQAPGTWTFTRYAPGTDNCKGGTVKCTPGTVAPAGDPVSEAVAKKAAAPVLKAVGQDDAKVDASQIIGAQRVVNADPVIGGLPTYGWTTGISVNARGEVVGGNGQLEAPTKGDTYPLLSAQEALDALNSVPGTPETPETAATPTDHRMGIGGCASPVPLKDRLESPCGSSTTAPQQETVTVDDAVLGLAPHTSGGRQVLVPSWLFGVKGAGAADGYTVTQPAVEPVYLKSATTPTPAPTPTSTGTSKTRDVQVDGYTVEGDTLVVSFTGGVCADYKATATESGGAVKVTVTETHWPKKVCIMIAKVFHQTVRLDASLGSRKVVGSDGAAIPLEKPGARLPQAQ